MSLTAILPNSPKGRWGLAISLAALAHASVGGGVAQWGYGGTGAGEEEAIQIDLPPLTKEEIAAAPKFVPVKAAVTPKTPSVQPMANPVVPIAPVPTARLDTPKDAPVLPSATPTPTQPTPAAQSSSSASAAVSGTPSDNKPTQNDAPSGTASNAKSGEVPADAAEQAELEADYKSIVRQHLSGRRFTPQQARKAGVSGSVKVKFTVDRSGTIRNVAVAVGSGHAVLDQEALAHIQKFGRVPGYPKTLRKAEIAMQITLKYDVERK